jgi:ubiquinone/menaquinone biosynthesis C-methylase UbiE
MFINAKEKSKATFEQQAARYDVAEDGEHARSLYPHLLQKLEGQTGLAVLDVGCGTGAVLAQLAERGCQKLAGLDLAPNMIAVARHKLGARADLRVGEADHLPWPAEQFEVVLWWIGKIGCLFLPPDFNSRMRHNFLSDVLCKLWVLNSPIYRIHCILS